MTDLTNLAFLYAHLTRFDYESDVALNRTTQAFVALVTNVASTD